MSVSCGVALAGVEEPGERERADRLQEPVAAGVVVERDEALVDQPADEVEHLVGIDVLEGAEQSLSRLQGEPAHEDAEASERGALVVAEQGLAPGHRGEQGLLPGEEGPRAPGEESEAARRAGRRSARGEGAHPGRGQLDGQRHAIEPTADGGDGIRVALGEGEARSSRARSTNRPTASNAAS